MDTTQHTDASFDPTLDGRELRDEELATIHGGFSIGKMFGDAGRLVAGVMTAGVSEDIIGALGGDTGPLTFGKEY